MAFAFPKTPNVRSAMTAWVVVNLAIGAGLAHTQLTQAAAAVRDVAPMVGPYLKLKAEGKV